MDFISLSLTIHYVTGNLVSMAIPNGTSGDRPEQMGDTRNKEVPLRSIMRKELSGKLTSRRRHPEP